ncbi:MAG: hypothetical protein K2P78_07025 [Gemmataceae bacterium]|nr:hypothetical protein [Gemmataceae bacterium]
MIFGRSIDSTGNNLAHPTWGAAGTGTQVIQRGRDHGLADYNATRAAYGLPRVTDFAQITSNPARQAKLKALYGSVNNIDLWAGALAENHVPGGSVGPTLRAIVVNKFPRLREGTGSGTKTPGGGVRDRVRRPEPQRPPRLGRAGLGRAEGRGRRHGHGRGGGDGDDRRERAVSDRRRRRAADRPLPGGTGAPAGRDRNDARPGRVDRRRRRTRFERRSRRVAPTTPTGPPPPSSGPRPHGAFAPPDGGTSPNDPLHPHRL